MNKLYVLVGVPGSGKSTWIKEQTWMLGLNIVSTDNFVEAYAKKQGKTYSEVFEEYMPIAIELMTDHVIFVREHGHDIIWDQTSTTVASRKRKFNMLPNYYAIAIVFSTPEEKELKRRLNSRPGKEVPWDVVQGMIDNFEMPTEEEGFKEIWRV
jgi:predicted kinase